MRLILFPKVLAQVTAVAKDCDDEANLRQLAVNRRRNPFRVLGNHLENQFVHFPADPSAIRFFNVTARRRLICSKLALHSC